MCIRDRSTTPSLQQAPAVLRESLMFPYAAGLEFVAAVRADKPWSRIDAVFRDPPVSTEQVLHPDKYLSGERPWKVTTASLTSLPQYKELRRDVLGELMYNCLLYTSDAADERSSVDLGGRRIIKKKKTVVYSDAKHTNNKKARHIAHR